MAVDDTYTKALLHMDGTDASTTFTDESGKTWTAYGTAQIDTAQSKFGGASVLFDGNSDYITTPDHADFAVGSGDFTIDFWFKKNANGALQCAFCQLNSTATLTTASILCYIDKTETNLPSIDVYAGGTLHGAQSATAITDTNWHHYAGVRNGNTLYLYIDGIEKATHDLTGITINDSANVPTIGRPGDYNGQYTNGWIDEFRFSKGIARWTANFTPPTQPYGGGGQVIIWSSE
jgi:hypothetical protein